MQAGVHDSKPSRAMHRRHSKPASIHGPSPPNTCQALEHDRSGGGTQADIQPLASPKAFLPPACIPFPAQEFTHDPPTSKVLGNHLGSQAGMLNLRLHSIAPHMPKLKPSTQQAAELFLALVGQDYDVLGGIVYGSQARGQERADSDTDMAVLLRGPRATLYDTTMRMSDKSFDVMLDTGVCIQAIPV